LFKNSSTVYTINIKKLVVVFFVSASARKIPPLGVTKTTSSLAYKIVTITHSSFQLPSTDTHTELNTDDLSLTGMKSLRLALYFAQKNWKANATQRGGIIKWKMSGN
jgi:hypothetical protein